MQPITNISEDGFKVRPNVFLQAVEDAPAPEFNTMIFTWNYKIKEYDLSPFREFEADSLLKKDEIREVLFNLNSKIPNYRLHHFGSPYSGWVYIVGFCLIPILVAILLINDIKWPLPVAIWLPIFLVGFIICCLETNWAKSLRERAKEIDRVLEAVNRKFEKRKIEWTVGEHGAYLMVSFHSDDVIEQVKKAKERQELYIRQAKMVVESDNIILEELMQDHKKLEFDYQDGL